MNECMVFLSTEHGTTWANDMNVGVNYTTGAGSIARPVDQYLHVIMNDL